MEVKSWIIYFTTPIIIRVTVYHLIDFQNKVRLSACKIEFYDCSVCFRFLRLLEHVLEPYHVDLCCFEFRWSQSVIANYPYSVRMYSIRDTFIHSIVSIKTSRWDRLVCKSVTIKLAQDSILSQNDSAFIDPIFPTPSYASNQIVPAWPQIDLCLHLLHSLYFHSFFLSLLFENIPKENVSSSEFTFPIILIVCVFYYHLKTYCGSRSETIQSPEWILILGGCSLCE